MKANRNSRRANAVLQHHYRLASLIIVMICSLVSSSLGATNEQNFCQPGIRNGKVKYRLEKREQDILLESLRQKTGFTGIYFGQDGYLRINNRNHFNEGSAMARKLLVAAMDGNNVIELENHWSSEHIVFAELTRKDIRRDTPPAECLDVLAVQLDLFDFSQLQGDKRAKTTFDPGLAVLHELAHAILRLRDDMRRHKSMGDCIAYVNQIRRELGLPERVNFIYEVVKNKFISGDTIMWGRLRFVDKTVGSKKKEYQLLWIVSKVGALRSI